MTDKSKNAATVAVGAAGAVVGAGAAILATKIMTDKNMRDKAKRALNQVKDQVVEVMDQVETINQKGGSASQITSKASGQGVQKKIDSKSGPAQGIGQQNNKKAM